MLEYYVSIQDSRYDTVIVTQTDNGYVITDENGRDINDEDDAEFFDGMEISPLKADDILIGRLMNIAPERIIMNADADKPVIKTLKRIFAGRLSVAD